jgi:hypothetical protein
MKTTLVILLILLGSLLAACEEPDGWASRGIDGSAECPAGQHVISYGPSGIPACAQN